jgi:hypothetical protein
MKRTERLQLVVNSREKDAARRLAEEHGGLSVAALVRLLIRQEARRHNPLGRPGVGVTDGQEDHSR